MGGQMSRTISGNYGTITLTNTADNPVYVTGTISSSTLGAQTALYAKGGATTSWTIDNSGLINSPKGQGIVLGAFSTHVSNGLITNEATGRITAAVGNALYVFGPASVVNKSG